MAQQIVIALVSEDHALVLVTVGDADEARSIALLLVEQRLAAGVQIVPIESIYRWKGETVEDSELLLVAKTRLDRWTLIQEAVSRHHSYEVAPILMIPVAEGSGPYLDWIDEILSNRP